jgi:hypothetical protein
MKIAQQQKPMQELRVQQSTAKASGCGQQPWAQLCQTVAGISSSLKKWPG